MTMKKEPLDLMHALRDHLRAEQEPPRIVPLSMIVTHDRGNTNRSFVPCEWEVLFEAERVGAGDEALYCPTSTPPERCHLCGHLFSDEERSKMDAYMLELALSVTADDEDGDEDDDIDPVTGFARGDRVNLDGDEDLEDDDEEYLPSDGADDDLEDAPSEQELRDETNIGLRSRFW